MTTAKNILGQNINENDELITALYCRLSVEDIKDDKSSGHCYVKVDIYFTGAGMFEIPSIDRIQQLLEEVRMNPEDHRLVA